MAAAAGGAIRSSNLGQARTSERIVSGLRCMRPKGRSVDPEEANISRDEKKTPTPSPISPSVISLKCVIKPRRAYFA